DPRSRPDADHARGPRLFAYRPVDVVDTVRLWPARNVNARCDEHVALDVHPADVATGADVDVLFEPRTRLRKNRPECDGDRRMTVVEDLREKRATQVLPEDAGHERERLRRSLERAAGAEKRPPHGVGDERRDDRDERESPGCGFDGGPQRHT